MKLYLESDASQISSIDSEFYSDISLEDTAAQLRAGIKAAREGNRAEAKHLLLRVTETEPGSEDAWMWLASVSDYPEELLGFLNHVLRINPTNARALEWTKSTKNLLSQSFVQRGTDASKDDQNDFARQCFRQAIAQDAENETAWLRLASISDSAEEKIAHLQKVLSLNPKNENAMFLLKSVKNQKVDGLLQKAVWSAVAGEREAAKRLLEKILSNAPELIEAWVLKSFLVESFEEKIDCFEKILDINDENELANVNWTALLDIMAKAELKSRNDDAEQVSASETDYFEESQTAFYSPETNKNFESSSVPSDEELETTQTNFEARTNKKETFGNYEISETVQPNEENEENFANPSSSEASEKTEIFEDAAQNYAVYSQPQSEFPEQVLEDFSQYAGGDFSLLPDALPSYYDRGEDILESAETAEEDYSAEFAEAEQDADTQSSSEAEESPVSDKENAGKQSFTEALFAGETFSEPLNGTDACPFCRAEDEAQSVVCASCQTMLTLSDLEMLLAHQDAEQEILRPAVELMEEEKSRRDFSVEELKLLAIGHINLKNLRQGCLYLNEASQSNPNDVVLSSQVNSLKIRLAEIEEQQSLPDTMPKNRKILVVDDSATVRKLISGKLEKSGHEVLCAVDGIDALEKIKQNVPDLILLDINMPRMDGYQVCKLIRGNETTKDVPVVMISGNDGFFDKVRGRMAGTTGYITKPFGPETLMKMVETYIV